MILLCNDKERVQGFLADFKGSACVRSIIELYLRSYGTTYDFAQFYIQFSDVTNTDTALVFRYNQTVYCVADHGCDFSELSSFLSGFTDVSLICDSSLQNLLPFADNMKKGAVMSRSGSPLSVHNENITVINEPKSVCNLVSENMSEYKKTDFFLNTSHQMRHGCLSVFAYMQNLQPVSVASVFYGSNNTAVIPFVYTGEYFRGNGYSSQVLSHLCSDPDFTYQLLCEEHNIKFYEKCGFTHTAYWVEYCL